MPRFIGRAFSLLIDLCIIAIRGGVVAARRKGVVVGDDCRIYIRNFGTEPFLISMGDRVTITSGVKILTHDGSTGLIRDADGRRYQRYSPVRIGSDVFIGVNTIILPGISIGSNVVIGAGSVVTKDVPDGTVVAGNPAKVVMTFTDFRRKVEETCTNDNELDGARTYRERVSRSIEISDQKRRSPNR